MTASARNRVLLSFFCAIACTLLLSGNTMGQTRHSSQGHPDKAPPQNTHMDERARPEQKILQSDTVTAKVTVLRNDRPYPVGGAAFARIEVSHTGKARTADAELRIEAQTAEIRSVTGKKLEENGEGQSRIVKVKPARKGKPATIIVELALRETGQGEQNALNITLQSKDGPDAMARFGWDVTDCAGGYYSEILKVREGPGSGIEQALEAARKRDKTRPGRWLFSPRAVSAGKRGKCLKSVRRWNKRRGRYVYRCTKFGPPPSTGTAARIPYERRVYRFASRLVSARAVDRELAPTRDSGWATTRVSKNLKEFLKQDKHPAICNGPLKAFDYYDDRLAGFLKRAATYDDMSSKAYALALLRTVEAIEASKSDPGGHPGWGGSPLVPVSADGEISLKQMTETLAQITGDTDTSEKASRSETVFAALKALSQYVKSPSAQSLADGTRSALQRALGAVEAADYITTVGTQYANLRHALAGSMKVLRQAHASKCTCRS